MAEEKKAEKKFEKSRFLKVDEIKALINGDFMQLKVADLKAGEAFCAKILEPVVEKPVEGYDPVWTFKSEYKDKSLENPVELTIQAGKSAVERLKKKFPEDSYVGKWCVFSKTSFEGNFPQFINPMEGEPKQGVNKDEAFAPKEGGVVDIGSYDDFEDFKGDYLAAMSENKKTPDSMHMMGSYLATVSANKYKELIDLCEEALKK